MAACAAYEETCAGATHWLFRRFQRSAFMELSCAGGAPTGSGDGPSEGRPGQSGVVSPGWSFLARFCIPTMRNVAPIVRKAIHARFPIISRTTPSMKKTMQSWMNAELPDLSARLFGSDVGFLSPFIYETLPELS